MESFIPVKNVPIKTFGLNAESCADLRIVPYVSGASERSFLKYSQPTNPTNFPLTGGTLPPPALVGPLQNSSLCDCPTIPSQKQRPVTLELSMPAFLFQCSLFIVFAPVAIPSITIKAFFVIVCREVTNNMPPPKISQYSF